MSRIGKRIIEIPEKTEVKLTEGNLTVKGPQGELSRKFRKEIAINIDGNTVTLLPKKETNESRALWGTYASHITNMINGVNTLFSKKLIIEGIGYKVENKGNVLVFNLGFSHPIEVDIPEGINVLVEKNNLTISGINKEFVGQFCAYIRSLKKPEPYKGKGIRYSDEVVRRKQGKKTA